VRADCYSLGSFSLFEETPLRELIDLAHEHDVYVSTVCFDTDTIPVTAYSVRLEDSFRLIVVVGRAAGPSISSRTPTQTRCLTAT
jgi:hypothetical protein